MIKLYFSITLALVLLYSCQDDIKSSQKIQKNESLQNQSLKLEIIEPTSNTNGRIVGTIGGCAYDTTPSQNSIMLFQPRTRELNQISSITKFSGLSSNFKVYAANISNAVATVIDNKRYILYDPNLLAVADQGSGKYWSSMSILAHEIGHHLSGHTLTNKGSNPHNELEADKYSGFVLYKLGASLSEALAAINRFGTEQGSLTHPAKRERIKAIVAGWNEANSTRYNSAIPPPPIDNPSDLCTYTPTMLISQENIANDDIGMYNNPKFLYGIITEVEKDFSRMEVHIVKTSSDFADDFRPITDEEWNITIDNNSWGSTSRMDHACSLNFPIFFVPGRRMKFSIVEGYPGCGTSEAGHWHLIYAKALEGGSM